ncbi:MAG: hypothetical protein R3F59_11875 [Myxococcota bacterium]
MIGWLLVAAAAAAERDPLPSLWVERPLATPRGWFLATGGVDGGEVAGEVRYGVLRGLELRAGGGTEQLGLGVRWSPWQREPPAASVAVDLGYAVLDPATDALAPSPGLAAARPLPAAGPRGGGAAAGRPRRVDGRGRGAAAGRARRARGGARRGGGARRRAAGARPPAHPRGGAARRPAPAARRRAAGRRSLAVEAAF